MATPVFLEGPKRSIGLFYKSEVGIMNSAHSRESFFHENESLFAGAVQKRRTPPIGGELKNIWHPQCKIRRSPRPVQN